jgi:hypothetical protein
MTNACLVRRLNRWYSGDYVPTYYPGTKDPAGAVTIEFGGLGIFGLRFGAWRLNRGRPLCSQQQEYCGWSEAGEDHARLQSQV